MEAGFWSGIPELTYDVHKTTITTILSHSSWCIIIGAVKTIIYYTTALCSLCLAVYVAYRVGVWTNHQPWLFWLFLDKNASAYFDNTEVNIMMGTTMMIALPTIILNCLAQNWLFSQFYRNRWWKCGALHLPMGLTTGLATGLLVIPAFMLVAMSLCMSIAVAVFMLAAIMLKCLIMMVGKHEAAAITLGVTSGGISGLCYGRWTLLAFGPTTLSIMVGAAAGLATA